MRKPIALVAALLLATSLAAGCGGDDSGSDDATTTVQDDNSDATTTTGDADATTTTGDAAGGTDTPSGGNNPDSDYCHAALAFTSDPDLSNADANVFADPELTAHAVDLLTDMHDAAPDEIKDDLQTFIDAFEAVGAALAQAGDDQAAQQQALAGIQDQFTNLQSASDNVESFTQSECGINVNGDSGDATTTTAAG